jgi:hypothetical protein
MKNLWERPNRLHVLGFSVLAGIAFIALMGQILTPGSAAAVVLLDYYAAPPANSPLIFPFTVQNLTHILLFIGFGEVYTRWRIAEREYALTREGLLPQHYSAVIQAHDLPAIRAKVAGRYDEEHGFLPGLIDLCILQFQASRSVDQTVSVLNSSLELISHRLDLRYSMLRYLVWVIPTVGFIGTVIGISLALAMIDPGGHRTTPGGDRQGPGHRLQHHPGSPGRKRRPGADAQPGASQRGRRPEPRRQPDPHQPDQPPLLGRTLATR